MASLATLHPLMRRRVESLLADPEAIAMGVSVLSAGRSNAHQRRLFKDAEARCRRDKRKCPPTRWVARPGTSNHEDRTIAQLRKIGYTAAEIEGRAGAIAVDFRIRGVRANAAGQWPHDVAVKFWRLANRHGISQRMPWEDWHGEPTVGWTPPPPPTPGTPAPTPQPPEDPMPLPHPKHTTAVVLCPSGGYYTVEADGGVTTNDGAPFFGSNFDAAKPLKLEGGEFFVGLVPRRTKDGAVKGYYLVTNHNSSVRPRRIKCGS